jgi:6-phosphogluconolactonase
MASQMPKYDVTNWHFFFADERCVPLDSNDSNYLGFVKPVFDVLKVPRNQIHTINPNVDPHCAAQEYQDELKSVFGDVIEFDVILLGMGPDGHTCSLFPNHPLLKSKEVVAAILDSPKPPPQRITLTFPVVNQARNAVFVCTGLGKADMLHRIIDLKQVYPASLGNYE